MQFKQCCICGLSLPIGILVPIQIRHQGKIVIVPICERCKKIKEDKSKVLKNEN